MLRKKFGYFSLVGFSARKRGWSVGFKRKIHYAKSAILDSSQFPTTSSCIWLLQIGQYLLCIHLVSPESRPVIGPRPVSVVTIVKMGMVKEYLLLALAGKSKCRRQSTSKPVIYIVWPMVIDKEVTPTVQKEFSFYVSGVFLWRRLIVLSSKFLCPKLQAVLLEMFH
jgi:hypothetical protein